VLGSFVAGASCSSTPAPANVAEGCSINSDCDKNLICAFGKCHVACETSRDCMGETCLPPSGVCELEQETPCSETLPCVVGLTCANDICRAPCSPGAKVGSTGGCLESQVCVKGTEKGQFICLDSTGGGGDGGGKGDDGGGDVSDATTSDAKGGSKGDGSSGTDATNSCPSAQTAFGSTAHGDPNPDFQSGVGARTAKDLYIFSGYVGPDPEGSDAGAINAVYVQAFDAQTAKSKGSASKLFVQSDLVDPTDNTGTGMVMYSSAVAPTGQIVLVYSAEYNNSSGGYGLYAAFLDSAVDADASSDGGAAGLQVQQIVLLSSTSQNAAQGGGQPNSLAYAVWSDASQAFVLSWQYSLGNIGENSFVAVDKFLAGGQSAGGGTSPVPTNNPNAYVLYKNGGSVGASGNLFGAAYVDVASSNPAFTVLDAVGNQVGNSFEIVPASSKTSGNWVAVAGTSKGFVYFYDKQSPASVNEVFLPTSGDAGVVGELSDGGDAGTFKTFSFSGAVQANAARAIGDEPGGAGGVGLALLYPSGVSFAYVNADGVGHQGPTPLFAHNYAAGDEVSLTNLAGSFVVSLYDTTAHSTQVAASGCQ
jgi:hypothetical protein